MTEAVPGEGRTTMRDVAARAGVSTQTVSNYLNRRHGTRPEIRRSIDAAISDLRYLPNASARSLRSQRTRSLGLVFEDPNRLGLHDPLHLEFLHGATGAARAAGHTVVVELTGAGEAATAALALVRARRVDGVLVSQGELLPADRQALDEIRRLGAAVVLLQQDGDARAMHVVSAEDQAGAQVAATRLLDAGHTRLAWLGAEPQWPGPRRRLEGARAACVAAGADLLEWVADAYTVEAARAAVAGRLRGAGAPTAVLAANDLVALGVIHQAEAEGVRVPDDLSVVGFNDFDFARWVRPAITTVRLPAARMAARAVELAIESVADPTRPAESVLFQVEVVERESTAARVDAAR
jgi:DNA-binding LacI/PurR family transcriptional regulator